MPANLVLNNGGAVDTFLLDDIVECDAGPDCSSKFTFPPAEKISDVILDK